MGQIFKRSNARLIQKKGFKKKSGKAKGLATFNKTISNKPKELVLGLLIKVKLRSTTHNILNAVYERTETTFYLHARKILIWIMFFKL
jgi:hypothetical protein